MVLTLKIDSCAKPKQNQKHKNKIVSKELIFLYFIESIVKNCQLMKNIKFERQNLPQKTSLNNLISY